MTVHKTITKFSGGFKVELLSDSLDDVTIELTSYELSRNNIRGKDVKSIKAANYNLDQIYVTSGVDQVIIPPYSRIVLPFYADNSPIEIRIELYANVKETFVFYYEKQGATVFSTL